MYKNVPFAYFVTLVNKDLLFSHTQSFLIAMNIRNVCCREQKNDFRNENEPDDLQYGSESS